MDDFDTQVHSDEFFDEADYYATWRDEELYDDAYLAMYDDDPSPYDGTYSEE